MWIPFSEIRDMMNENLEGQLGANNEIRTYSTEAIANEIQIFQPYRKYKAVIFFWSKLNLLDVVKYLQSINTCKEVGRNFTNI